MSIPSLHDYQMSGEASRAYDFYALLMAAMQNADTENLMRLRMAFPEVWEGLDKRYNSPGGMLEEERPKIKEKE